MKTYQKHIYNLHELQSKVNNIYIYTCVFFGPLWALTSGGVLQMTTPIYINGWFEFLPVPVTFFFSMLICYSEFYSENSLSLDLNI